MSGFRSVGESRSGGRRLARGLLAGAMARGPRGLGVAAAAAWLLLQFCDVARSREFNVSPSPKYDACVFLNALSEDPRFSGGYEEDRRLWLPAIRKDPELSRAFDLWRGRGVELAHLLSATPESLDGIAEALRRAPEDLYARIGARLAEPAYEKSFAFLKAHSAELIRVLDHLRSAGFPAYWEKRAKGEATAKSAAFQSILSRDLGPGALADASRFAGKDLSPSELCATFFSGPFSFALAGGGACLSIETELYEAAVTALHEYLHAFNPDPEALRLQHRLREGDEFYAAATRRIYEAGGKGREEEFVQAAELYASVRAGLRSHKEALRQARFVDGGLPLAGVLYVELRQSYPAGLPDGFDYNAFLKEAFARDALRAGNMRRAFASAIEPVSGLAGMKLAADGRRVRIAAILDGHPAGRAGLRVGDVLVEVDGTPVDGLTLPRAVDLVSGRPGDGFSLMLLRDGRRLSIRLELGG